VRFLCSASHDTVRSTCINNSCRYTRILIFYFNTFPSQVMKYSLQDRVYHLRLQFCTRPAIYRLDMNIITNKTTRRRVTAIFEPGSLFIFIQESRNRFANLLVCIELILIPSLSCCACISAECIAEDVFVRCN